MSDPQLLFTGCKFCWKARKAFDLYVILHSEWKAYELVSYERTLQQESHRIYLDSEVLATKVKSKGGAKQGKAGVAAEKDFHRLVVDYVLSRLLLQEFVVEEQKFTTRWHYLPGDLDDEQSRSLIIAKPAMLFPYQPKYFSPTIPEIVQVLLNHPKHELQRAQRSSTTPKSLERWRGPLILCKVKHGRHLSAKDARSFRRLQLNLPTDEDVARMEKVLKINSVPKLQAQASSRGLTAPPPLKDRSQSMMRANSMRGKALTGSGAAPHAPAKLKRGGSKQGKMLRQPSGRGKGGQQKHPAHPHGASGDAEDDEDADGFGETPDATGAIGTMLAGLAALSRSVKETFSFKGGSRVGPEGASCDSTKHRPEAEGTPMMITPADSKVLQRNSSDMPGAGDAAGEEGKIGVGASQKRRSVSGKVLGAILQGLADARDGVRQWGSSGKVLPAT